MDVIVSEKDFPIKPKNIECKRINFDNFFSKFTNKKSGGFILVGGSILNEELANDLIYASLKLAQKNGGWTPFDMADIMNKILDGVDDYLCYRETAMAIAKELILNGIFVVMLDGKIVFPFKTINLMYFVSPVSYGFCITEISEV